MAVIAAAPIASAATRTAPCRDSPWSMMAAAIAESSQINGGAITLPGANHRNNPATKASSASTASPRGGFRATSPNRHAPESPRREP